MTMKTKRSIWIGMLIVLTVALGSTNAVAWNANSRLTDSVIAGGATQAYDAANFNSCTDTFSDLPADSIFYPYVRRLTCEGVVSAFADGSFRGGESVTRGEMARWIALAAGYTDTIPADRQTFLDVLPSDANWLYIEQLQVHGIVTGYACEIGAGGPCPGIYFRPENFITRAQTSKLVTLAAGYGDSVSTTQQTFREVPPTHPYWLFVERAAMHGLINGYDCDNVTFNMCGPTIETCPGPYYRCCIAITRTQAAKFVARAFFPSSR
jgi:hypothetical protein